MDAFFASVEQRENPLLQGKPVAVAGKGRRGVVSAASYEARVYGVRSAMPTFKAKNVCPKLLICPGDYQLYSFVSSQIMQSLKNFSDKVYPASFDEAILDVSGSRLLWHSPKELAVNLRRYILEKHKLASSIGIAASPLLAKIASEAAKPILDQGCYKQGREIVVVEDGDERKFLGNLHVGQIPGVGPVTTKRLFHLGIKKVKEMADLPRQILISNFGVAHGNFLHSVANGNIETTIEPRKITRSLSQEVTFEKDIYTKAELEREILQLVDVLTGRLRNLDVYAKRVGLKVKDCSFRTMNRSTTLEAPLRSVKKLTHLYRNMLTDDLYSDGVRLLGVSATGLTKNCSEQLFFDFDGYASRKKIEDDNASSIATAVDEIRARFGHESLQFATVIASNQPRHSWRNKKDISSTNNFAK